MTPVAAACDPVTPETESACLPHQPKLLPHGFQVHQHLAGQVLSFPQNWYKKILWLRVSGVDGKSCFSVQNIFRYALTKHLQIKADMAF